jgi:ubiquinone/menaquinone biosynthesis C-methylase UbiE
MSFQEFWWGTSLSSYFKNRRFNIICNTMGLDLNKKFSMLDVGCATGKDFIHFVGDRENVSITGIDIDDYKIEQKNVTLIKGDAERLEFKDKSFDFVISMGVLEHIEPIEKLCNMISEIDRVSKSYCIVVPCINTNIEPHIKQYKWQIRDFNKKKQIKGVGVNYFSDDAWLKFKGFSNAKTKRFWYIPGVFSNLMIYKKG